MLRWPIIRTLLYKEALRYRYNWSLLVTVVGLLALAGLLSLSARLRMFPGQEGASVRACYILYRPEPRSQAWTRYLTDHPPPAGYTVLYQAYQQPADFPFLPPEAMAIELTAPPDASSTDGSQPVETWKAR